MLTPISLEKGLTLMSMAAEIRAVVAENWGGDFLKRDDGKFVLLPDSSFMSIFRVTHDAV